VTELEFISLNVMNSLSLKTMLIENIVECGNWDMLEVYKVCESSSTRTPDHAQVQKRKFLTLERQRCFCGELGELGLHGRMTGSS